jgi:hypothetical protein
MQTRISQDLHAQINLPRFIDKHGTFPLSYAQFGFPRLGYRWTVAFQSDYGEQYDLSTNAGNTGIGTYPLLSYILLNVTAYCCT